MDGPTTKPFQPSATTPNPAPASAALETAFPLFLITSPNAEKIPDRDGVILEVSLSFPADFSALK